MKVSEHIFDRIVSPENLFAAWGEFTNGKKSRADVMQFEQNVERQIFALHRELVSGMYRHGAYEMFTVCDPKRRRIHKASVRDRLLHNAVVRVLDPIFDATFIAHSFSSRRGKGTHRAVDACHRMLRRVSGNATKPCFALQCDIRLFFASVDHHILLGILERTIHDARAMRLIGKIVGSHSSVLEDGQATGLPLGNVTSQLFAGVIWLVRAKCDILTAAAVPGSRR